MSAVDTQCCYKTKRPAPFGDLPEACQFLFDSSKLINVGGHLFCPFHLPMHLGKRDWPENDKIKFRESVRQLCIEARDRNLEVLDLSGVIFPDGLDRRHIFCPENTAILLHNCQFHGGAYLSDLRPAKTLYLHACYFGSHLELSLSENVAVLGDCSFATDCTFEATIFSIARFNKCKFHKHVRFDRTTFRGPAEFISADFEETVTFEGARFEGGLWFSSGENKGIAHRNSLKANDFSKCSFKGVADFSDRKFHSSTDFSESTFFCAPKFHNSSLHQNTSFDNANFLDIESNGASRAYRTLKQEMEKVRAWDAAGNFFVLEQRAKLLDINTPRIEKWISRAYGAISNYGNSITRPLFAFTVVNLIFLLIYTIYALKDIGRAAEQTVPQFLSTVGSVVHFWLIQIVHPFSALKDSNQTYGMVEEPQLPLTIGTFGALQSICGLTIIALFLLAIRRRFKLD